MAPPLMRYLVRRDFLDELGEFKSISAQQTPALRGVEKGADGQVDQHGPGLAEAELGLLRNREPAIGQVAEPGREAPDGVFGIDHGILRQCGWCHAAELRSMTQIVWQLTCGVSFEVVLGGVVVYLFLLVGTVVKAGDR